jgi:phosphoenolpyruvate phosphomutase
VTERRGVYWVDLDGRTARLRDRIAARDLVLAMAAHSPLSARLVEEAGFDAVWASGFELATLHGVPDDSIITMKQHVEVTRAMAATVRIPVIANIDTGFGDVEDTIVEYQRAAVAGMRRAFTRIAKDGGTRAVEGEIASVADLLALQRRDQTRA